jgi:hypothetical protein
MTAVLKEAIAPAWSTQQRLQHVLNRYVSPNPALNAPPPHYLDPDSGYERSDDNWRYVSQPAGAEQGLRFVHHAVNEARLTRQRTRCQTSGCCICTSSLLLPTCTANAAFAYRVKQCAQSAMPHLGCLEQSCKWATTKPNCLVSRAI